MVVALHGAKGCLIGHAFSVKPDFIIVAPHGRGQTGYRDFGEVDIFEAIDEVRKRYRIDEDRIYLTGHSMGGGGTFRLAVRYPHLWAAVAPMASAGARPFEWLRNLLHIPTLFYHGSEDEVVPVQMAREAANYIRQLGYNFRYEEVEGKPHWWGVDFPEMFAFFAQHRRVKSPDRIVFWTNDPRANRAYWLEIADFDDYTKPASVEVGTRDEGRGTRAILTTENVREVVVHLSEAPEGLRQLPLVVEWNGKKVVVAKMARADEMRLRLKEPIVGVLVDENETTRFWQWQQDGVAISITAEVKAQAPTQKTPSRCGPITDVFTAPFLVVYDAESEGAKWAAKQFQHWWRNYALGVCSLTEFRNEDELQGLMRTAKKHLVVFRKVKAGSQYGSITFERDGVRVGKRLLKGKSIAARTLLPNPFDPQHYLLVNASVTDEGLKLLARLPMDIGRPHDYLVVDERFLSEGVKGILAVGQWSRDWR